MVTKCGSNKFDIPEDIIVMNISTYDCKPQLISEWYEIHHRVPFLFWHKWKVVEDCHCYRYESAHFTEEGVIHYLENYKIKPPNKIVYTRMVSRED